MNFHFFFIVYFKLKEMKNFQIQNLAKLSQFLILERVQSISLLKVIEFAGKI